MSLPTTKDNKRDRVIDLYKEGKNMREIAKEVHLSFSTIGKMIRESTGQVEPKPDKSITSRAFQLFQKGENLVSVTIKLDLNPTEADNIHTSYLRLQGKDQLVANCAKLKNYIPDFIRFVRICVKHTPERERIFEMFNIENAIEGLKEDKARVQQEHNVQCIILDRKRKEIQDANQRIENLKQEEYNRWVAVFGNGNNYYTTQ